MGKATIMQSSFNGGELSPLMDARIDQTRYANGCSTLRNMFVHPHGPASRRPGLGFCGEARFADRKARLVPFVFSVDQSYALEIGHLFIRVWKDGGQVLDASGDVVEISTPWTEDALASLCYCQSADIMYFASPDYPPMKLCRYGHEDWRLEALEFGSGVLKPQQLIASADGAQQRAYRYVITLVDTFSGEESLPCTMVEVQGASSLNVEDCITLNWQPPEGVTEGDGWEYRIYKCWDGSENYGYVATAKVGTWIDRGVSPDFDQGPPEVRNPFAEPDTYPSVVQFYQQRLCFAASRSKPQTIWTSRSGNYENLNVSSPLRADDAVTATIAADRVNCIRWMLPAKQLLIGTVGGEWVMGGANGEPLSPMSVELQRQTVRGSSGIMPVVIGSTVLFVQRCGKVVREFTYSLEVDGYAASDLTVLSEHMTTGGRIVEWAYQQSPHSIVWCVLEDGGLVAFTYEREHKVVGWHRHDTDGLFESVCTVPSSYGDELWVVVRRTVDGVQKRYIERLAPFSTSQNVQQAFYVDSGCTYSGEAHDTISGLAHLEGKLVSILADGYVHPSRIVTDGAIQLDRPASRVTVGLPFVSELSPMKPELPQRDGTSQGRTKRVSKVWVRLYNSLGLKAGPREDRMTELVFRMASAPLDEPLQLFSGDKEVAFDAGYDTDAKVLIRQEDPLPCTILAVIAQIETGDR